MATTLSSAPASTGSTIGRRQRRGPAQRFAAAVAVCASLAAVSAGIAGAEPPSSSDLKAKAAKIAAEQDRLKMKISELDEQYNLAKIRLDSLQASQKQIQATLATSQKGMVEAKGKFLEYAREAYTSTSTMPELAQGDSLSDAMIRKTLLEASKRESSESVEQLRAAKSDLADKQKNLEETTAKIDAEQKSLESTKAAAEKAAKDLAAQGVKVSADLKVALAAEEAARQKAAEEAARRAAAAADAARAARAAAAASSSSARQSVQAARVTGSTSASTSTASSSSSARRTAAAAVAAAPEPAPAQSTSGNAVVDAAMSRLGKPYSWGASGPNSFDCSGLLIWSFAQAGRGGLPHSSGSLYGMSTKISVSQLQPGDIVAYGSPIHHIGIYIGGGQYVHAPHSGDVVKVSSIYRSNGAPMAGRL